MKTYCRISVKDEQGNVEQILVKDQIPPDEMVANYLGRIWKRPVRRCVKVEVIDIFTLKVIQTKKLG